MKYFIYLCCIAHLLTEISARLRLTTPMPSALRSNVGAEGQDSNIAEIIDFITSVYNDDGRSIARIGLYDPKLRRFELPIVQGINTSPSLVVPNDADTEKQLGKLKDTARYHVIDNPEVLEEYSIKQQLKNIERLLKPVPVVSETSAEAKAFSTVENKLRYYHSESKSAASDRSTESNTFNQSHHTPNPNPLDGLQELTTVKNTYRPSFPNDDDDDKFVTEDVEETITEKETNTPTAIAKNHDGNTEKLPEINKTVEIEKRTVDNKALDKGYQARIEEEKAQIDNTTEIGQIKQELPLKTEKNNDPVTINEEKSASYKEYNITTKLDQNSNEKLSEGSVRPRNEYYKNDGNKLINGTTDTNSAKDKKSKERTWDANIVKNVSVEKLMGRIDNSALRTKQNSNHDHKEQYSLKETKENSNKHFINRHEKRDKYDRKKKDKIDDGWSKKEKDVNKIDKQRYNKDIEYDRMEHEWNKRHQQYDENDNLDMTVNDSQWDKNDGFNSRDYDSNKRDDDWKKRDFDSNTRDRDWNKRKNEWIKQESKPDKDDRNKNDWDNKSEMNDENDRDKHDRYEIVDRKRKDGDFIQHSEV